MNKEKPKKEADKYDRNDHTFRDALRRHELQEITTTKKNGAINHQQTFTIMVQSQ